MIGATIFSESLNTNKTILNMKQVPTQLVHVPKVCPDGTRQQSKFQSLKRTKFSPRAQAQDMSKLVRKQRAMVTSVIRIIYDDSTKQRTRVS